MKYVYPNNLMARRSEKREIVKGGLILGGFFSIIILLFLASDYAHNHHWKSPTIVCSGADANSCHIE